MSDEPNTTGPDESGPMSAVEAAQRAGVNEKTIRRAIQAGKLRASKVHGAFRITVADLEEWQREQQADMPGQQPDPAPDMSPVVDELRRVHAEDRERWERDLERERKERQEWQEKALAFNADLNRWRGLAEAYQHQVTALTARVESVTPDPADVVDVDPAENARQASPNAPGTQQPPEGAATPVEEATTRRSWWQRLIGSS